MFLTLAENCGSQLYISTGCCLALHLEFFIEGQALKLSCWQPETLLDTKFELLIAYLERNPCLSQIRLKQDVDSAVTYD